MLILLGFAALMERKLSIESLGSFAQINEKLTAESLNKLY